MANGVAVAVVSPSNCPRLLVTNALDPSDNTINWRAVNGPTPRFTLVSVSDSGGGQPTRVVVTVITSIPGESTASTVAAFGSGPRKLGAPGVAMLATSELSQVA